MADHAATVPGMPKADHCQLSRVFSAHKPLRFVWHHVQPQVCGGLSDRGNLASLCDNCHYAVHRVMYALHVGERVAGLGTRGQRRVARRGYLACLAAGTADLIPKEG